MPAEPPDPITDPEQARQFAIGQRALRRSMVMSVVLDVLIAVVLVIAGVSVIVVVVLGAVIVGLSVFMLNRITRAGEQRLAYFRDPVTGRLNIPDA
jgi:cell division protein FtsW (lipid II flippase)